MKIEHLARIINFIYQGEVRIQNEDLKIFLELAEQLKLKGFVNVKELPEKYNSDSVKKDRNEEYKLNIGVQVNAYLNVLVDPNAKKLEQTEVSTKFHIPTESQGNSATSKNESVGAPFAPNHTIKKMKISL